MKENTQMMDDAGMWYISLVALCIFVSGIWCFVDMITIGCLVLTVNIKYTSRGDAFCHVILGYKSIVWCLGRAVNLLRHTNMAS